MWQLLALLDRVDEEVLVDVGVRTVEEARRIARLLPGADVDRAECPRDPVTGAYLLDVPVPVPDPAGEGERKGPLRVGRP
ncbi:hypothetical protein [Streptomyces sp. bgisy060]|uniref:hypothetical protein n=1 Tax=Streptomyces sp. bgisy060 TaxID=3413775 RepID=UPI003EBDF52D